MPHKNPEERKQYLRDYYFRNKEKYRGKTVNKERALVSKKKNIARNRIYVQEYKTTHPCADCDLFFHPWVMEFDHLDSDVKSFGLGSGVGDGYSLQRLQKEMDKCELVCANCHRMRTWKRSTGQL
jgi:hypothetical protein